MSDVAAPRSAKLGDSCLREIPHLLTKEEIRDFSRIESTKFTAAVALEILWVVAAVCISETWFNPFTYALAVIIVGSRIHALGALMHDTVHYRAYSNRLLNDVVGEILALPTSISMAGYRNTHFGHHRELNSDDDPDWRKYSKTREYAFPASRGNMWIRIVRHLSGLQAFVEVTRVHVQKHPERLDVPAWVSRGRLAFLVALTASAVIFGFWKLLLLYWIVPLLTVFLAIRYFRNVAEHYMVEHDNVLNETRTVIAPFWQLWLIAPWGINYHIEHHLFPGVPCFRLAELHRLLMTRPPYPQLAHVTHGYFGGLLRECASPNPAKTLAA